jgi:AAA+ ATPase superfamily predicted ATPase
MLNNPLLNRTEETERLTAAWKAGSSGRPQLAILWGRRRVGKTFLLSHFVQGKRSVFFAATRQAEGVELRRFAEAIRRDLGDRAGDLAAGGFANWEVALRFVASLAEEAPLGIVLDEVPYLARSSPGFASIVQSVWDHLRRGTKLLLILTGSAVGTIEEMLGPGGALRGRPALQMRLDPLDPKQARLFLRKLTPAAFCEAYAACGGYPLHLKSWDQNLSTTRNLRRLAFTAGGLLLEDAAGILSEELPEKGGYQRVLGAIGRGRTRHSEISGEAEQRVDHPLDVLIRSGFVRKDLPLGAPKGLRPTYALNDPYLAFWFRVLYAERTLIEGGQGRAVEKRTARRALVEPAR